MEDIKLIYHTYEEIVLINYFTNDIKKNNDSGTFIIDNNILKITWNKDNFEEEFIKNNDSTNDMNSYKINENYKDVNIFINNNTLKFTINYLNKKIFNESTIYDIQIITENIINIKINFKYYNVFKLKDQIYYDVTNEYNEEIYLEHQKWNENCIINKINNLLYRKKYVEEFGSFELSEDKLIVYWEKWAPETFIKKNDIYIYENIINSENIIANYEDIITTENNIKEIFIFHKDWSEYCILNNNKIHRKTNTKEEGYYSFEDNKLIIKWDKWDQETFYNIDNSYYYDKLIMLLNYHEDDYIINLLNNKIYDCNNYYDIGFADINSNNIQITWYKNNKIEIFDYILNNNKIMIIENIYKDIILKKLIDKIAVINTLNNKIHIKGENKKGIYNIDLYDENIINIYWDDEYDKETYYLQENNIFIYHDFYKIEKNKILLVLEKDEIELNINYNKNILFNNNIELKFIHYDKKYCILYENKLDYYYLDNVNINNEIKYFLIIENIYFNKNDLNFNFDIFKLLNKDLNHLDDIQLYLYWIRNNIDENRINLAENTFLKKNNFFNSLSTDSIINFYKNGILSNYFYSKKNIEIVLNTLNDDNDLNSLNNENDLEDKYFNNPYNINLVLLNKNNLDNYINILDNLNKDNNIIIHYEVNDKEDNNSKEIENYLMKNFKRMVIFKSKNMEFIDIISFILDNLSIKNINNLTFISKLDNYISNYNILIDYFIDIEISKIDLIQICIFLFLIKKNINKLFLNNFTIDYNLLKNILL